MSTFRQIGQDWTSGELHERFPDQIKFKRSVKDDIGRLEKHVCPLLQDVPIDQVTLEHCQAVMQRLPADLKPATRRNVGQLVTRIMTTAVFPLRHIVHPDRCTELVGRATARARSTRCAASSVWPSTSRASRCSRPPSSGASARSRKRGRPGPNPHRAGSAPLRPQLARAHADGQLALARPTRIGCSGGNFRAQRRGSGFRSASSCTRPGLGGWHRMQTPSAASVLTVLAKSRLMALGRDLDVALASGSTKDAQAQAWLGSGPSDITRLDLPRRFATEPQEIERPYTVARKRLSPVGLVVLWPKECS